MYVIKVVLDCTIIYVLFTYKIIHYGTCNDLCIYTSALQNRSRLRKNDTVITLYILRVGGTRWRSWLGHCGTSRKVAGSIPDGVIRNFH